MLTQGFERTYAPSRASQSCMSGELDGSCGHGREHSEKHQRRAWLGVQGTRATTTRPRSCQRHSQGADGRRTKGCGAHSSGGGPCGVSRQTGGPPAGPGAPPGVRVSGLATLQKYERLHSPAAPAAPRRHAPARPEACAGQPARSAGRAACGRAGSRALGVGPGGARWAWPRWEGASHSPGALQEVGRQQAAPLLVAEQVAHHATGRFRRHVAVVGRRLRVRPCRRELHAGAVPPLLGKHTWGGETLTEEGLCRGTPAWRQTIP